MNGPRFVLARSAWVAVACTVAALGFTGCGSDDDNNPVEPMPTTAATAAEAPDGGVEVVASAAGLRWRMPSTPSRTTGSTELANGRTAPTSTWTAARAEPALVAVGVIDIGSLPYSTVEGLAAVAEALGCGNLDATVAERRVVGTHDAAIAEVTGCDRGDGEVLVIAGDGHAVTIISIGPDGEVPWSADQIAATITFESS